ncbi:hypothetical protein EHP00_84 [Ecytonucleospora hepatopenaei]|uniref:Uncharacterized protein n=1 Tax=Ecytonucleospora hepatopenaei TaxID=646526 RepID=A0A1W0E5W8_9MICR|nr:hypothetical protein EHP00_84 [Ecytonucleospora hepatopenaei]
MDVRNKLIKNIEKSVEHCEFIAVKKCKSDIQTIENDVNRTYFKYSVIYGKKTHLKIYKNILFEMFRDIPVPYYQGMIEIGGVLVEAFLSEKVRSIDLTSEHFDANKIVRELSSTSMENLKKLRENHAKNAKKVNKKEILDSSETESLQDISEDIVFETDSFYFHLEDNQKKYIDFKKENRKTIETIKNGLTELLRKVYIPLVSNNFKLYKEYNSIFCAFMHSKGVKISKMCSFLTAKHILTFFCRDMRNVDDIYVIFNTLLEKDPFVLFVILGVLRDQIEVAPKMDQSDKCVLPDNFSQKIKECKQEIQKTQEEMKKGNSTFIIAGAVTSAVAIGAAIFFGFKQNK